MSERFDKDLVGALVADLAPVRPVHLGRTVAIAVALEIALVAATVRLLGVRMADLGRISDPAFAGLLLLLAGGAAVSAVAMTAAAIPGRPVPRSWRWFLVAVPPVLASFVLAFSPWGGTAGGFAAVLVEGFGCTKSTLLVATPAWIAGLLLLRRLGPLDPLRTGLFASFTALFTAAMVVQMACPRCDSWHLAISHYVPLLLSAWIGALLSPLVLGARRGSRRGSPRAPADLPGSSQR